MSIRDSVQAVTDGILKGEILETFDLARACGHTHLNQFTLDDLTTWRLNMHHLSGVPYAGVTS